MTFVLELLLIFIIAQLFVPNFPSTMKFADVSSAHTKDDYTDKKIISESMYKYMENYIEKYLLYKLYGFRKRHSSQVSFAIMHEDIRKNLHKRNARRAYS